MHDVLVKVRDSENLVALYTDINDYNAFAVGYVQRLSNDKIIILNIGPHGEFDGYSACYIDDIYRVEIGSKYLQKIEKIKKFDISDVFKINEEEECFCAILKTALKIKKIVIIDCCNSEFGVKGHVIEYSNEIVRILQLTEYGELDGETVIRFNEINKIVIGDIECEELGKLQ